MAAARGAVLSLVAMVAAAAGVYPACPDFVAVVNYPAGTHPVAVTVGDFNGAGRADGTITDIDDRNMPKKSCAN